MPRRAQRHATFETKNATGSAIRKHRNVTSKATPTVRSSTQNVPRTSGSDRSNAAARFDQVNESLGFWVTGSSR